MKLVTQFCDVTCRLLFVFEAKLHCIQVSAFLVDPLLRALLPQHIQILEHVANDVINMVCCWRRAKNQVPFFKKLDFELSCLSHY